MAGSAKPLPLRDLAAACVRVHIPSQRGDDRLVPPPGWSFLPPEVIL